MKFFVTGGSGFIGSHLVDRLISEENLVTVFDNFSSGKKEFTKQHLNNPLFSIIEGDLLDFEKVRASMKGCDAVFHLAANPDIRLSNSNTSLDLYQETIVTYNVLEAMRINNVRQIVFSSSSAIYGKAPTVSLSENYGPLMPISLYGAAKLSCEALISAFSHLFGIQGWIFRFANIIGSRATHGVIYDFIRKLKQTPSRLEILGDGNQSKPYLHVQECVDGMLYAYKKSNDRLNYFNLGCSTTTDVNTIAKYVIKEMNLKNVQINYTGGESGWPGDVPQVRLDVRKMKSLGWKAKSSSNQAVKKAIKDIIKYNSL